MDDSRQLHTMRPRCHAGGMKKQTSPHNSHSEKSPMRGTHVVALKVDESGNPLPLVQLLPAGLFRARDGRPQSDHPQLTDWLCDAQTAAVLIARFAQDGLPLLIDYEHQTLLAEDNGKPAPASGWGGNLQWVEGEGLFAEVEWTAAAKEMIRAGEYKFLSPVFIYDLQTGRVSKILHAALTNYPALTDLRPVAARHHTSNQDDPMPLKPETTQLLGVAEAASADDIHTAVVALKAKADNANPDPAKFVPISALESVKQELAALKARQQQADVDALIEEGKASGKLLPAQEAWARELGNQSATSLRSYLDSTPAIAALKGNQTNGKPPADAAAALTDAEREAVRIGGWSEKAFGKGGV